MDGWMETFTGFIFLWRPTISQGAFFFQSDQMFCVNPAAEVTRWHLYLTFLPPHSGNCHMRGSIFPTSPLHSRWMSSNASYMGQGASRWPAIQDPLLNNFSQWEAIDNTVLDARLKCSECHQNDCVNEAQTDCYYHVICCICCVKIYQLCSKGPPLCQSLFYLFFVSS